MKKIKLPENWFIKGCPKLKALCDKNGANVFGDYHDCVYYNYNPTQNENFWRSWNHLDSVTLATYEGKTEISFELFLKYINGEEVMEIQEDLTPLVKLLNNISNE